MNRFTIRKIKNSLKLGKKLPKLKDLKELDTMDKIYLAGNLTGIILILVTPADNLSVEIFEFFNVFLD
ncbi:MAG: hypothetical protein ACOCRO_02300 [Halanaerobiales bacterium]